MKKKLSLVFLISLLFILCTAPTYAGTKGVRLKATFPTKTSSDEARTYILQSLLPSSFKMKAPLTNSCVLYLQKSLFTNGGYINICFDEEMYVKEGEEYYAVGGVNHRDWLVVGRDASEKSVAIGVLDETTGKTGSASGYATLSTVGNYYKVTIKKLRSMNKWTRYGDNTNLENQAFDTKTNYYPMVFLCMNGDFDKKVSGTVYIDEMGVTGSKTVKVGFEKTDYLSLWASRMGRFIPATIATISTK